MKKPRSIMIVLHKWFRSGPGHMLHSAHVYVDGVFFVQISDTYGNHREKTLAALSAARKVPVLKTGETFYKWS